MAEYRVRIWRRTEPLTGDKTRIKNLEHDEVSLEASSRKSALNQVFETERAANTKRVRLYVRVETPSGGHEGIGDYTLIELAHREDEERRAAEHGEIEK
jgi:hypothetical protein